MSANPTKVVGAFLLERTYRSGTLAIYNVYAGAHITNAPLALLWRVSYATLGLAPEWHIKCHMCPSLPKPVKNRPVFATRERALRWLNMHITSSTHRRAA